MAFIDDIFDATEIYGLSSDYIPILRQANGQRLLRKIKVQNLGLLDEVDSLDAASALVGTEPVAVIQGGVAVQTTAQDIADLAAVPTKATGAEVDTGTDDVKFVTPKAIADSSIGDGVPRWSSPKRIYAVQNQTLAVTSNPRAATGDFTFGVNPSNGDTMPAINGFSTLVFKTVAIAFPDIQMGIDLPTTLATLASELEANKGGVGNELLADLTFAADATHLFIAQTTAGVGGNTTTLGASTANIVRSGATLTGGSDGGDFTVLYDSVESNAINFNDNAAAVQAALEAIPVLTGHVTVTGDMPTSNVALDSTITVPLLFVLGTNNLVDGAGAGAVDIFVTDASYYDEELLTPAIGDRILNFSVEVVEAFGAEANVTLSDGVGGSGDWSAGGAILLQTADIDLGINFSGNISSEQHDLILIPECAGKFPTTCRTSAPIYASFSSIGGTGKTTGIVDVYICVATPPVPFA